ncbi:MAG: hypothetical protein IPH07_33705 [Deltaproteobacteria bacterium]|nr:hypothetical protein [Deltaproteobacteria bacterium]MBK8716547.1 hypothetical protein [Deltaproteobacteria bacterium]
MSGDPSLRCRCGSVRGRVVELSPASCSRVVCYCRDCRAYLRWLGADALLDAYGGTEIIQLAPRQLTIEHGAEQLRCVRLSEKGLMRWYAACCRTPVANAVSGKVPFIGVAKAMLPEVGDAEVGAAIGIHGRLAPGGCPPGVHPRGPLGLVLHASRLMLRWWWRGMGQPSAFYDEHAQPRVVPEVLGASTRTSLAERDRIATPA